jgi:hypothetical protein
MSEELSDSKLDEMRKKLPALVACLGWANTCLLQEIESGKDIREVRSSAAAYRAKNAQEEYREFLRDNGVTLLDGVVPVGEESTLKGVTW